MIDRPSDDAPERDDEQAEDAADELPEGPEPATWAGRQGWKGLPDEPEDHAGEFESPVADADEGEGEEEEAGAGDEAEDEDWESEDEAAEDEDWESEDEAAEDDDAEIGEETGEAEPGPGETVEADTPSLADREEAQEAALAGLQARTAEHAAKRGVTDPGPGAPAKSPEGEADEADEAEHAEEDAEEQPEETATAVAAAAAQPAVGEAEVPADQQRPPGRGLWARFVTASFLIIVSMATATSVSLLVYLTDIAKGLGGLEGLSGQLDALDEKAQNFLILGSDVRPEEPGRGRSDTTMLLRVDPDNHQISQLSIPRDLQVNIPGHGVDRFNAAYTYGGPKLTLQTVKDITGDRIAVNHVVNVDFNGFADAVDAIDCVYVDVDHHYFHSNEGVLAGSDDFYSEIDIQAGYQRLCGFKALQYVRYRHEDNDIVRSARQQAFLREARQKVPPRMLLDERDDLIDIFTQYTTSDINDAATLVQLFKLMLDARNAQINQVQFPFESLDRNGYVTASDAALEAAISDFLGETPEPPAQQQPSGGGGEGGEGGGGPGGGKPEQKPEPSPAPAPDLIDSTGVGQQYSTLLADQAGNEIKFPILYPTRLAPASTVSDTDTRWFRIDGPGDEIYRGYKFVVSRPGTSYPTAYYGVSGTDWVDAPLFANPSEEREVDGRTYKLYYDSGHLRMVAFQRAKAMYWVTNTLENLIPNDQMLGIAQNLAVPGG